MVGYKGNIGWKAEGFLNPATTNLQMGTYWIGRDASGITFDASNNLVVTNNIAIGTGLIGYDGTASEGLSIDTSGNVTLEATAASLILPLNADATTPTLAIGGIDNGFYADFDSQVRYTSAGVSRLILDGAGIKASINSGFRCINEAATSTNPTLIPNENNIEDGLGSAASGQPSMVGNSLESQRWIPVADTDSDNTDVLSTGVSGFHGLVLVRSITDNTSAIYRVSNVTVSDVSLDGDHTSTKGTASHYNFYYETDQFKLENKVGDNKSVSVVFWVLPT